MTDAPVPTGGSGPAAPPFSDYPPPRQTPCSASSSLPALLTKPDDGWDPAEPLIKQGHGPTDRFSEVDLFDKGPVQRQAPSRRLWLTLALVIIGLLCVDLWRAVGRVESAVSQDAITAVNDAVALNVTTTTIPIPTPTPYGYNPREKTVILFGECHPPRALRRPRLVC